MVVSLRYIVPAALAVAGVLLSPLLRADEAAPLRSAGQMQPVVLPADVTVPPRVTVLPKDSGLPRVSGPAVAPVPSLIALPQTCISDWSEAGPIVRREGLATIERVGRIARDKASLEIVTSALCRSEGGYVYRLRVRGGHDGGKAALKTLFVDARQPFER